jgi:hypothetical protein
MAPLLDVPVPLEILQRIVGQLDPIALISLSQTSKAWRALINPTRHDFIQRLLALELTPEYGGIVPLFDEYSQTLTPPCESSEWKSNKYACCGCMKLRTHMMFDNHAILRRPYRKPPPGSVEADRTTITDWEPLETSTRWGRIQERAARAEEERKKWARIAARCRDAALNPPAEAFARVPRPHDNSEDEAHSYLIGAGRQKRRCIECMRRAGNWSRKHSGDQGSGQVEVMAVKSRQLKFSYALERYFPGLVEHLPPEKVPRHWRGLRGSAAALHLTLYAVYCPSCETWQEYGAFRELGLFKHGFRYPAALKHPLLCNDCHIKTHRDPSLLAQELSSVALAKLRGYRSTMAYYLGFGWRLINRDFNGARSAGNGLLNKYKPVGNEILNGLQWVDSRKKGIVLDEHDLPDLRHRFERYRHLVYNEVDSGTRSEILRGWFPLWVEEYYLIEGMYSWLGKQIAWLESDPNAVLDYVLKNDPHRIQREKE